MAAYIVATVRIHDMARFKLYSAQLGDLSAQHGGEPLVRGGVTALLEGEGEPGERIVVTRFPSAEAARAYIGSDAYKTASQLRIGAADVIMRLVE